MWVEEEACLRYPKKGAKKATLIIKSWMSQPKWLAPIPPWWMK